MKKIILLVMLCSNFCYAKTLTVAVQATGGHKHIGEVKFEDTQYGLMLTPNLSYLPPGPHGFHIHAMPSCADDGMAAGGHYDPQKSNSHLGPYKDGHLGDLPVLWVNKNGNANTPILAPRLKLSDLKGLTLMIHQGGDNYSNQPKLGGGGARIACGIIPKT